MGLKNFFVGIVKFTLLVFSLMLVGALSTFVTLRLFTSGDEVAVPNLTGKNAVEAIRILHQHGLQLKILPQKRYSDSIPAEKIVAQRPESAVKIKQGRSVEVYLSLGPEKSIVPELIGLTSRVANMTLEQRGLHEGKIIRVAARGAQPDEIVAQYPAAGTTMTGSRAVNLLINGSLGDEDVFVMPDAIGKNRSEVEDYFRSAGLRVASSQPVDYPGLTPGTIVKQTPPAGYKVNKDTYIGLYYSK